MRQVRGQTGEGTGQREGYEERLTASELLGQVKGKGKETKWNSLKGNHMFIERVENEEGNEERKGKGREG